MSPLDALPADLKESFADLQGAIDGLTHEQLVRTAGTSHHTEHAPFIRAWREREGP